MGIKSLLSPSEEALAALLKGEAITSPLPEQKGADILVYSTSGLLGMQRKSIPGDFISSFTDGRLARSLPLLVNTCKFTRLVCEGHFRYWPDGTVDLGMMGKGKRVPSRFTREHIHGMLNDIEFVWGVQVHWTESIEDTVRYIRSVGRFLAGSKHTGLYSRPSAKGVWYVPSAKDLYLWILQSFPGIGPSIADNIVDHFDGKIPLQWTCTLKELQGVSKLTTKKAQELWDALPHMASEFDKLRMRIKES